MDKFKKVLLVFVCCVAVAGCDSSGHVKKSVDRYTPILNAKPKYFITIKTIVVPSLRKKIMPVWSVAYETTNKACEVTTNELEGVVSPRGVSKRINSRVVGGKYADIVIPIDKYLTGYCGWKISAVSYRFNPDESDYWMSTAMIFGGHPVGHLRKTATGIWRCRNSKSCRQISLKYFTKYLNNDLSVKKNYVYYMIIGGYK